MTSILYLDPELIIALSKKVIFVNPNDLQIFKEVELPEDLTKCEVPISKPIRSNDKDERDEINEAEKNNECKSNETLCIEQVQISPNGCILAVATSGQKAILLYQLRPEHAKLISIRPLARTSSALTFSNDSKMLLVTDKSGDCYQYDCIHWTLPGRLIFGHLSIVYDVLWTKNSSFIVTCDRDDKIKVSNYPATYDIYGYCLGHKEFVSALSNLNDEIIVSISGDKTMRLWSIEHCSELLAIELPAPGIRLVVRAIANNEFIAAVLMHKTDECVGIYKIIETETCWEIKDVEFLKISSMEVTNLCFAEERLFVVGSVEGRFTIKLAALEKFPSSVPDNWIQMVENIFCNEVLKPTDVDSWFKKKYDNVSDYLERKKRRMEEKNK